MNKPINVDILYDKNDITFMFSKKEFCRMMSLSQKKYDTIITDISDNTQYKLGRFRVLKEENWNNIMRNALDILEHASDKSLSNALQEYIDTHKQDIPDHEWLFGYCDIPALIYLSYCNTKKIALKRTARTKKDAEMLHCRLDKKISDALTKLCNETGLTKTMAVERALKTYVDTYKKSGKS